MQSTLRQQEIAKIWSENRMTYRILGGLILVGSGILLGGMAFENEVASYITNLYTETMSIVVTVFILDLINRHRNEQQRVQELREALSRQLGSGVNVQAKRATEELKYYGWLEDGMLHGVDLSKANLEKLNLMNADLDEANFDDAEMQEIQLYYAKLKNVTMRRTQLQGALLYEADMTNADLSDANLSEATAVGSNLTKAKLRTTNLTKAELSNANLTGAVLANAKLERAKLNLANLQNADLFGADLRHAQLNGANLTGARLKFAKLEGAQIKPSRFGLARLDETTILPDGSSYDPKQGLEQLERFINPEHPNFWRLRW